MVHAQLGGVVAVLLGNAGGDHDHRQLGHERIGTQVAHQVKAVHARHLNVRDQHRWQFAGQHFQPFQAVLGQLDAVAFTQQQALGDATHCQRVVNHHDQRRFGRCPIRRPGGRRLLARRRCGLQYRLQYRLQRRLGGLAGQLTVQRGQGHRVVDQRRPARRQQGHADQARQPRQLRPKVLDHHFLVAQHLIDMQRHALVGTAHHHDHGRAPRRHPARAALQQRVEPEERHAAFAKTVLAAGVGLAQLGQRHAAHDLDQG